MSHKETVFQRTPSFTRTKKTDTGKRTHYPSDLMPITLKVSQKDIAEMDYWINECPLGDPWSNNAIAVALKRVVKPGITTSVFYDRHYAKSRIGHYLCELGSEAGEWMRMCMTGRKVEPASWTIWLPRDVLRLM